jgi:DNA-binding IclR family transcriptional regulator
MAAEGARRTGRIQSLERMDAILGAIAAAPDGAARLSEVAAETGLHKNTVFSLLRTLLALGYCEQSRQSGAYRIGQRSFELARMAERNFDIVRVVRPLMRRLALQYRESLSLPCRRMRAASWWRRSRDLRRARLAVPGAGGALARLGAGQGGAGLAARGGARADPRRPALRALHQPHHRRRAGAARGLRAGAGTGFATSVAEEERGASAVAAPSSRAGGSPRGAIALWGPSVRLTRSRLAAIGPVLAAEVGALQS